MPFAYKVNNGKLFLQKEKPNLYLIQVFGRIFRTIIYITLSLFIFCIVLIAYSYVNLEPNFSDLVAFGAIFTTLGSSLVSVASLWCGQQYHQFESNTEILQTKLTNEKWEHWPFIRRITRRKIGKRKYEYQVLENPCIVFNLGNKNLNMWLPSVKADFNELFAFWGWINLKIHGKNFRKFLGMHGKLDAVREILIWDCVTSIYQNVLLYKISKVLIWFGGNFVCFSIFFSFFYSYLSYLHVYCNEIFRVLSSQ
jgi:hypothetical protein